MSTALQLMRAEMEKLMGTGYNGGKKLKYSDPEVCKNYNCGLCVHDMFDNTKFEIPHCTKVHNDELKSQYEEDKKKGVKTEFESDFFEYVSSLVEDCERYKRSQQRKVEESNSENASSDAVLYGPEIEQCAELVAKIGDKLAEAERLGEQGEINKSIELMQAVEEMKKTKTLLEEKMRASDPQIKKLRICDVCGSFLNIFDNDRRLADHFSGKLHTGRLKIAAIYKELIEKEEQEREKRRMERKVLHEKKNPSRSREPPSSRHRRSNKSSTDRESSREQHKHRHSERSSKHDRSKKSYKRSRKSAHKKHRRSRS